MAFVLCPMFPGELQALRSTYPREIGDPNEPQLPNPWERLVHPEGDVYFYNHENRAFTWVNPRQPGNAASLENAIQQLRQQLLEVHIPNEVHVVLGYTNEMYRRGVIGYYLAHCGLRSLGWVQFTPQTFGFTQDIDERFFESLLSLEYWKHISYYPSGTAVDLSAERDLIGRLFAGQLGDVNLGLTPFTPEECRNHLSLVKLNQETQADDCRMAEIGRLLAVIHAYLHSNLYGVQRGISRVRHSIEHVPKKANVQPKLYRLLQVSWQWLIERLADVELSCSMSCACSVMLASANCYFGGSWLRTGGLLSFSIPATLLLHSKFPRLYSDMESFALGVMPNKPIRNLIMTCLFVFNALGYGVLLWSVGCSLRHVEQVPSAIGIVMATLVLAFPPIAYVIWSNHALAREDF